MKKLVVHFNRETSNIYIGRPSRWGNPYHLGPDGNRVEVLLKYDRWLEGRLDLLAEACRVLPGKVLGCWCDPRTCHGEILAAIANNSRLILPLILKN